MNGSRILLVEDDRDIGTELVQALASHGHSARLARGGGEALSAAISEPPDLVLLDLGLPDIDGVVLCRRLRAAVPEAIIVVLTARTGEFDVVAALDAGADDYLMKPFRLTELMARLRAHLRRRPDPVERTSIEAGRLRLDVLAARGRRGAASGRPAAAPRGAPSGCRPRRRAERVRAAALVRGRRPAPRRRVGRPARSEARRPGQIRRWRPGCPRRAPRW